MISFIDRKTDENIQDLNQSVIRGNRKPFRENIKTLNRSFWLICGMCFIWYAVTFTYIQISDKVLQVKYKIDEINAGRFFSLPYMFVTLFSPFIGLGLDKYGLRIHAGKIRYFVIVCSYCGVYDYLFDTSFKCGTTRMSRRVLYRCCTYFSCGSRPCNLYYKYMATRIYDRTDWELRNSLRCFICILQFWFISNSNSWSCYPWLDSHCIIWLLLGNLKLL